MSSGKAPSESLPVVKASSAKPASTLQEPGAGGNSQGLPKQIAVDLGNGVNLEMVLIPAGEFMMGSSDSDPDAVGEEKPQHRVRITKSFYLGKYLLTQAQWQVVMGNNPSEFSEPENPVETVSWDDCQAFLVKLNAKSGGSGGMFQLPTEAQWEYACRAGSRTKCRFGDDKGVLGEYAWYEENSGGQTHPVGEKKPNALGLYDMHGNVYEWCQDWFDKGYYANSPIDDPAGPATGSNRVCRGGSWLGRAGNCRSADRFYYAPECRHRFLGLRVARVAVDTIGGTNDAQSPTGTQPSNVPQALPKFVAGNDDASMSRLGKIARDVIQPQAEEGMQDGSSLQVISRQFKDIYLVCTQKILLGDGFYLTLELCFHTESRRLPDALGRLVGCIMVHDSRKSGRLHPTPPQLLTLNVNGKEYTFITDEVKRDEESFVANQYALFSALDPYDVMSFLGDVRCMAAVVGPLIHPDCRHVFTKKEVDYVRTFVKEVREQGLRLGYLTKATDGSWIPAPSVQTRIEKDRRAAVVRPPESTKEITNSIRMKLKLIPAGEFMMGSSPEEIKHWNDWLDEHGLKSATVNSDDEGPQHRVRITRPFYLGVYHVTRGQFRQFVEDTGFMTDAEKNVKAGWGFEGKLAFVQTPEYTWRETGFEQTDDHPVVNVSWNDAMAFCQWLSRKEGKAYRLPTEAEWEYACRAGTTTRYYNGDDPELLAQVANVADAALMAQPPEPQMGGKRFPAISADDGYAFTAPVGEFRPNAFGLYDMHGNVFQWCSDWYGNEYYAMSPVDDPQGRDSGASRVNRGGCWRADPGNCRSAVRGRGAPVYRSGGLGFRVSLVPAEAWLTGAPTQARAVDSSTKQVNSADASRASTSLTLGDAEDRAGQTDKAISWYTEAIRLNPRFAKAYANRGSLWIEKRENSKGIADLTEAIRLNPGDTDVYCVRAVAWALQRDWEKALADCNSAIQLDSMCVAAYKARSMVYKEMGETSKAAEDFRLAESLKEPPKQLTVNSVPEGFSRQEWQEIKELVKSKAWGDAVAFRDALLVMKAAFADVGIPNPSARQLFNGIQALTYGLGTSPPSALASTLRTLIELARQAGRPVMTRADAENLDRERPDLYSR